MDDPHSEVEIRPQLKPLHFSCMGLFVLLGLDYFLLHLGEIFNYNLFRKFLIPFLFLFFFWDPYNLDAGAFDIFPEVSETILSSFHYFYCIMLFRSYFCAEFFVCLFVFVFFFGLFVCFSSNCQGWKTQLKQGAYWGIKQ